MTDREKALKILNAEICPYCGKVPEYVDSKVIYGKSYGMVYLCRDCDAYVGVHKGTDKPLGRLANKELREWKKKTHKVFDPIWKNKIMTRQDAYSFLAEQLNINPKYCHIGMFSVRYCKLAIECLEAHEFTNRKKYRE